LLGTAALSERYFSSGDGIEGSITSGSHNFINDSGLYICTTKGALYFDNNEIFTNEIPPMITVSEVNVDGEVYYYNQLDEELTIPSDTQRVEISFSVLSFSNRENIKVQYQLEGFDSEPIYLDYDDNYEAVYTNLEGGTYFFKLSAANGDGVKSTNDMTFKITKELGFFEYKIVRIIIVVLILAILAGLLIVVFKYQIQFMGKNKELENLTREHEDALKNNTAKTDYLANMSNEIKTPVNAIISSANNILKDVNTDENTQSELSSIIDKSQDVISMVDETIQLARLESGSEIVLEEPYSISTLICDISDNMLNKLTDKPIKFLVDLGKNLPDILIGDFDKIKNVLEIILDNSIKYTKEGSITLSVECYDYTNNNDDNSCNLVFSISDTGTGISDERLEHIFEIYYIDESKKSVVNVGNGVSMSIAKKLSDIMEGELVVDSTYGAGSTFTFSLTQDKPDVDGKSIPLNENTIERVSREEAERMRAPELKILLVDDVEISRNVAYDIISSMEIKCDTASSGISAIDMVINNDYDLIFMDIGMPVMNGVEVLKEIKELSDSSYADLPVIAMSEDVIGKNRNDLIEEGFSDVILKPFDLTVLAGIVIRFADPEKVKYKSNDVTEYISESRYGEGLKKLEEYMDVLSILDKIGGNIDVYNRILSTFYNQNKDAIKELDEKLSSDFRGFRNKIHNIRNGCQNIGAFEAAEIILKFEDAINSGNKNYVRNNTGIMYDCIQVLTETIKEYLDFVNEDATAKDKEVIPETGEQDSPKPKDYDPNMDSAFIIDPDRQEIPEEEEDIHEEEDDVKTIDIDKLRTMREATYLEDINTINNIYLEICDDEYVGEDVEFLKVLGESIEKIDFVEINDLLGTYISLKSSL
ncbi:MAG: response regulator, partial [Eubacterium sp.]|nr:response regulator [Eubacterium sp.]